MKTLWILAAAATFAACHNRAEDETGAAPDRGDSTSVSGYDTTATQPSPSTTGYDTTSTTMPSADTSSTSGAASGIDTTSATDSQNPSSGQTGYDTTSTSAPSTGGYDTTSTTSPSTGVDTTSPSTGATGSDTVRVESNSETMQGDSAMTNTNVPDSSSTQR
ncbi:MAG TPA: hypothetical protein VMY76_05685 [Gemmatimonadales bacterium]|nr:hypothetical protein [Gemmatimonadales bacterium]